MGYAEKLNPNSQWNKNRNKFVVNPVSTPAKRDEPMVMEIKPSLFKDFLCRLFSPIRAMLRKFQSHAPTS